MTRLIALYTVGVFISFTLSQIGMIRHWNRLLADRDRSGGARPGCAGRRRSTGSARSMTGRRAGHRADHEVHPRRLDRDRRDGRVLRAHDGHPAALRPGRRRAGGRRVRRACCPPATTRIVLVSTLHKPTLRAARLRPGDPARRAGGGHRQRRRRGHQAPDPRLGEAQTPGAAEGHRVAVPGDHPAGPRLRQADPHRQPARRGHRVHPGVRRRALVGADPAQPERAAAQGPAAVPARGDGHQRALAAGVLGNGRPSCARRRAPGSIRRGYEPVAAPEPTAAPVARGPKSPAAPGTRRS